MAEEQQVTGKDNDAAVIESAAESEKSLEELLKEFPDEQPSKERTEQPKNQGNDDVSERLARLEAAEAKKQLDNAIDQTVGVLTDAEGYEETPKRIAVGYLHALAAENPHFQRAFANRGDNPEAWKRAMNWAAKEFRKEYKPTGGNIADDIKAARASARGQSEQPERPKGKSAEEIRNMSPADFRAYKKSLGR